MLKHFKLLYPDSGSGSTPTSTSTHTPSSDPAHDPAPDQSERIRQLEAQVKQLQADLAKATVNNRQQPNPASEKSPDEIVKEGLAAWAAHNFDPSKLAE